MKTVKKRIDRSVNKLTHVGGLSHRFDAAFGDCSGSKTVHSGLIALQARLITKLGAEFSTVEQSLVGLAVNEALTLAAQTDVPTLVLPVLAEEKVRALRDWTLKQHALLQSQVPAFAA